MTTRLGDRALRFPRPAGAGAAILDAVRAWPGVVDAALTEAWVAVYFADDADAAHVYVDPARLAALAALDVLAARDARDARHATAARASVLTARTVDIPVRYDGADLEDVARACGVSIEHVVTLHTRAEYTVLFLGFMPGFAYLGGLPRELEVPRLASPRAHVPKNAVAIAGAYAGVYPFESPGGWQLLGTATAHLFDLERGALLRAGDRVRFHEVRA